MPPDHELMELDIPEDVPEFKDVLEEVIWLQSVLSYPW